LSNEHRRAVSVRSRDDSRYKPSAQRLEARDSCRILVVDDDALVRARLSALLNAAQYDVEVATTGEEALRILDATHCHIVLTDWQMPDMDGLALCRHIRLRHHEGYVYVLMLTIRDGESDALTGLAAGADAYVIKGAPIDDILARLEIGRRITCENSAFSTNRRENRSGSYTDPVTGAHNLGYLVHHLPRELARSQRHGHAFAILHCHIDAFEQFHERFGHEAANDLLRAFVAGAEGRIRKEDWLARTTGAAFVIVLPETAVNGAHCAAQQLRQLFTTHLLTTPADPIGFTVSIGVTAVDAKHDVQSAAKIDAVLHEANRGSAPRGRHGGKHGLN
jgi:two-component system, cell cycle response regulator